MILDGIGLYLMLFPGVAWHYMVLDSVAYHRMVFNGIASININQHQSVSTRINQHLVTLIALILFKGHGMTLLVPIASMGRNDPGGPMDQKWQID